MSVRSLLVPLCIGALALAGCDVGAHAAAPPTTTPPAGPATTADAERYSLYDLPSGWRDERGTPLRLASLAGTARVVAMVYTDCHATCPLIVADLKRIEASLTPADRDAVGFVLVSLDPERDTPGRLANWARRTQLDSTRWTLLNGDADAVRELAAALGVRYRAQADGSLAHTNVITVLDAQGAVRHRQVGLDVDAHGTIDAVRRALR